MSDVEMISIHEALLGYGLGILFALLFDVAPWLACGILGTLVLLAAVVVNEGGT